MYATRKYILGKEATALITSEHLKRMIPPICLENSLIKGQTAAALGKACRTSGPRGSPLRLLSFGKRCDADFLVVGFGSLGLEHFPQ